jgi:hypothetical protein
MTNRLIILLFTMALALTIVSCDKDTSILPGDSETITSEDVSSTDYLIDDSEEVTETMIDFRSGGEDCPTVTFLNPEGTFPNTITLDFGDGCEGPKGHVRKGIMIIEQSAPKSEAGATRITTFDNFFIDQVQVEGVKTWTNNGYNENGFLSFTREVENGKLTFPNGKFISWSSSRTMVLVEGGDTPERLDDVFEVTGSKSGINRQGIAFNSEIVSPLIKPRNCKWTVSGLIEITVGDKVRTIDFGNGECDRLAEVTFPNGMTKVIKIHRRWW